ncbi:MAG: NAD(P)H-quinone oxidoreductase [Gemmatimonadota bacterium]
MRAVVITQAGDPGVLQLGDVARPEPDANQIRVRVHAAGVNRADVMQRRGNYPAPAGVIANVPGLEYAGVVDVVGTGVTRWQVGERVMGLVGGGGYAEFVVVHEDEALPVPASMSFEDAAAVPEAFLAAHDALTTRLDAKPAEAVLIHAVASGVGTAASQLAKALGCFVLGTTRSAWKLERVAAYGVDVAIAASRDNFVDVARAHTGGRGVDAVVDLVGGDYLTLNVQALAPQGRIVVVGLVAGAVAPLDMRLLLNRRATIVGTVMRSRSLGEKIEVARAFQRDVMAWLENGTVKPVVDKVLKMDEAPEAHRIVEANANFGKIVLKW